MHRTRYVLDFCHYQREDMGLLEYQPMPSLRDVAHDGVLCTFGTSGVVVRVATWTVHHVQNHTLLGHSPPASQAGRHVGPAL